MSAVEMRPLPTDYGVTDDDIRWAEACVEDAQIELDEAMAILDALRRRLRDQGGVVA